jgi:hypothetical protein
MEYTYGRVAASKTQAIVEALTEDDGTALKKELGKYKGEVAARYLLEALLTKGHGHTLQSTLGLLK